MEIKKVCKGGAIKVEGVWAGYGGMYRCKCCGKEFCVSFPEQWAWRCSYHNINTYLCSYTCMRTLQAMNQQEVSEKRKKAAVAKRGMKYK